MKRPSTKIVWILLNPLSLLVAYFIGMWFLGPQNFLLKEDCSAKGWHANAVIALQGNRFWRGQLEHIDNRIAQIRNDYVSLMNTRREAAKAAADLTVLFDQVYNADPLLRPSRESQYANALRDQADAIEEAHAVRTQVKKWENEVLRLKACRNKVSNNLQ